MAMSRLVVILVTGWVTSNASDSQETCAGTQQHSVTASSLAQLRSSVGGEAFRFERSRKNIVAEMALDKDEQALSLATSDSHEGNSLSAKALEAVTSAVKVAQNHSKLSKMVETLDMGGLESALSQLVAETVNGQHNATPGMSLLLGALKTNMDDLVKQLLSDTLVLQTRINHSVGNFSLCNDTGTYDDFYKNATDLKKSRPFSLQGKRGRSQTNP